MPHKYTKIVLDSAGVSDWVKIDEYNTTCNMSLNLVIDATVAKASVEMSISPELNDINIFSHELLTDVTESRPSTINYPISYIRLNVKRCNFGKVTLELREVSS